MMETHVDPLEVAWFIWIKIAVGTLVLILAIVALLALRRRPMDETPRFLWAMVITLAPVLGPIVFYIVRPEDLSPEQRRAI